MKTVIGRSWVYLHLATDGSVLYVGTTYHPQKREKEHRGRAPWWPQVYDVRHFGPFPADRARRLERWLIEELDPPHNLLFTSRCPLRSTTSAA